MRLSRLAACLACAVLTFSCTEGDGPALLITGNVVPTAECVYEADNPNRIRGLFDTSEVCTQANEGTPHSYFLTLRVESQLINRGSPIGTPPPVRADPNGVSVSHAEVELLSVQGTETLDFASADAALINPFTVAASGNIRSAEDDDLGVGFVSVPAIPADYARALREDLGFVDDTLLVSVRLFGKTSGDIEVESERFQYAVDVCEGCSVFQCSGEPPQRVVDMLERTCNTHPGSDGVLCAPTCWTSG